MKSLGSFWSVAVRTGALIAVSSIGFIASRPVATRFDYVTFFISLTGLLGGFVVLAGVLVREGLQKLGCRGATAKTIFRHFIGIGFGTTLAAIIALLAMDLGMLTWDPEGTVTFSHMEQTLSAAGGTVFKVFIWPAGRLATSTGHWMPGWLSLLSCSLIYGAAIHLSITLVRVFLVRKRGTLAAITKAV